MTDDNLYYELVRRYGTFDLDGYCENPDNAVSYRACQPGDLLTHDLVGLNVLMDLSTADLETTREHLRYIGEIANSRAKMTNMVAVIKVLTTSAAWAVAIKYAKYIHFIQGDVYRDGKKITYPIAVVQFSGEVKGSPMVSIIDMAKIDPLPADFSRRKILYSSYLRAKG